jgi:hypothetical protein
MTPKEKAEELFDAMSTNYGDENHHCTFYVAKNCALIAVDEMIKIRNEIINTLKLGPLDIEVIAFLEEVKQEIEKL